MRKKLLITTLPQRYAPTVSSRRECALPRIADAFVDLPFTPEQTGALRAGERLVRRPWGKRSVGIAMACQVEAPSGMLKQVLFLVSQHRRWSEYILEGQIYEKAAFSRRVRIVQRIHGHTYRLFVHQRFLASGLTCTWCLDGAFVSTVRELIGWWRVIPQNASRSIFDCALNVSMFGRKTRFREDAYVRAVLQDTLTWVKRQSESTYRNGLVTILTRAHFHRAQMGSK